MNDPHVVSLKYRVRAPEEDSFDEAQPLSHETDEFTLVLEENVLRIRPRYHHASADDARAAIELFLRSWEIDAALGFGRSELRFDYEDAEIIDRNPPAPGTSQIIGLSTLELVSVAESLAVKLSHGEYPAPPVSFVATPDVETLWQRFEGYLNGREPLSSTAYFCITLIEARAGGRAKAAHSLNISRKVLSKLGELASTRGSDASARKAQPGTTPVPLTEPEVKWVEDTVKAIIRRIAEVSAGGTTTHISMGDLPSI